MDWQRGLFRLWVLCSITWIVLIGIIDWSALTSSRTASPAIDAPSKSTGVLEQASTEFDPVVILKQGAEGRYIHILAKPDPFAGWEISHGSKFITGNLDKGMLGSKLEAVLTLIVPPILFLIAGSAIPWMIRGFRKSA